MKNIVLNIFDYVSSAISGFDRYPKILSFTYKKKEEFKTIVGGIISIATYVVLLLYAYVMLRIMFEKRNTSKGISLTVNDLMNDLEPVNFQSTPFMFAILNDGDYFDILNDEAYINMTVLFTTYVKGVQKSTEIPLVKCEFSHFPQIKLALLKKMNITNYILIKNNNKNK